MRTAADLALVLAALPFLCALGMGLPVLLGRAQRFSSAQESVQALALAGAAGLLVHHAIGVIATDLAYVLIACAAIAAASLAWAAAQPGVLRSMLGLGWARWTIALGALLVFAGPILFEPLQAWDARSIWFFHAKRIYYDGGLDITRGWGNPAYGFSHLDYPKLLPLLAAQFAHAAGFWNEYVPKAALLALLAPVVLGLLAVARRLGLAFGLLAAAFLLGAKELMWNGYADAYLAAYAGLSLIFVSRWLQGGAALDLACGIVYLAVAANLKNEGTLVAACLGAVLALFFAPRAWQLVRRSPGLPGGVWLALALGVAGYGVWAATKLYWGAHNDLQLGLGTLARAAQRVGEGGLGVVGLALLKQAGSTLALIVLVLAALLAKTTRTAAGAAAWLPAAVAALYTLGIAAIYLGTPHDLRWHLATSAERTMLVAMCGFFASAFLLLESVELSRGRRAAQGIEGMGLQT